MRKIVATVVVLIAVASAGALFLPTATLFGKSRKADWPTAHATRETLVDATVATGTVKPQVGAEVKVGSQVSGVVSQLKVNVGDHVDKGDLLALVDDAALQAEVRALEADVGVATAEERYETGELARYEKMGAYIASIDVDKTRRDLAVKRASIAQAQARLAEARIKLGYTRILAPVAGTIASVSTNQGETVAASLAAPTFTTIIDLSRLEIHTFVDEADIGKVAPGQKVTFRVDSFPNRELEGVVQAIYPKAELVNNVVNYVVIVDIPDSHGLLIRPEMTAHVSFTLAQREDALTLPRSAVFARSGKQYVVLPTADGWAERPITTGMRTAQRVEVVSGLDAKEIVLADSQLWVARGDKND